MSSIEVGQTWVNRSDGSVVVVRGRSDLLVHWWRVESVAIGSSRSIDEPTLLALYRLVEESTVPMTGSAVA